MWSLIVPVLEHFGKQIVEDRDMRKQLNDAGHLHVTLESGQEFGLSKHDTTIEEGTVVVDSKRGHWEFDVDRIEFVDVEPSGPVVE